MNKQNAVVVLALLLFLNTKGFSQLFWEYQNPIPTSSELKKVQFVSEKIGWAIGSWGTLIHTIDGGTSWNLQQTILDDICDISFIDDSCGWLIGIKFTGEYSWGYPLGTSCLVNTKDGGNSWQVQTELDGITTAPFSVFFVDKNNGWITITPSDKDFSATILKTYDGGKNWTVQDSVTLNIMDTYFLNDQRGWAVGGWSEDFNVTILSTADGGENWIDLSTQIGDVGLYGALESVYFLDENIGWAVGTDKLILKTTDGGLNWNKQNTPYGLNNVQFTSVCFSDSNKGFIAGWGPFLTTKNGGQTWSVYDQNDPQPLFVCFWDQLNGWRVGYHGLIQYTSDGGQTWINQNKSFTNADLIHIDFINKTNGWLISPESIYHSDTGGQTWQLQKTIPTQGLRHIFVFDKSTCWIVGYNWEQTSSFFYNTSNGGLDWDLTYTGFNLNLNSIYFINDDVGIASGDSGLILKTIDGGTNWEIRESKTSDNLVSVDFISNKGWVLGSNGSILHTLNGGENWSQLSSDGLDGNKSINFIDSLNGWVVGGHYWPDIGNLNKTNGSYGYILKTNDGGKTWEKQFESTPTFNCVNFIDVNNGWVSGGPLLYTNDGGKNWIEQDVAFDGITASDFVDENNGWIVGMNGAIMHASDGTISVIESKDNTIELNTTNYVLYSNYPNPFNPSTTIKYSIPEKNNVTLKVFDVLGSEVATLVKKEQTQGNYELEFDGADLTSGIYFYRLQAGAFTEARKMILLK